MNDSRGSRFNAGILAPSLGSSVDSDAVASTAAGPINDAVIAAYGSDVDRHEQEWDDGDALDFDRV